MSSNADRFWIQTTDDADDTSPDLTDWYAVVDESAGGIVAYADSLKTAQVIRDTLIRNL